MQTQSEKSKLIFVDDLERNFGEILYLFEDLNGENTNALFQLKKGLDKQDYIDQCKLIYEEIAKHQDLLYIFASQLIVKENPKNSRDFWAHTTILKCIHYLDEAIKYMQSDDFLLERDLEKIDNWVSYAHFLWEEKYEEYFFDSTYSLAATGYRFSKKTMIFSDDNPQQIFLVMMQNALQAEKLFFSLSRNKNHTALTTLKNTMMNNRTTQNETIPIQAQTLSGRSLITAMNSSVEECLKNINQADLIDADAIALYTGWHKQKKMNWNRERVIRGYLPYKAEDRPLENKHQFQPIPGQIGNIKADGVGKYGYGTSGKIPNILEVITKLTKGDPEKESNLAKLLLRYKRGDGSALSETELRTANIELPNIFDNRRKLIKQFNHLAFLICFHEVSRRTNQGYKNGQKVPELPFGVAISCILKLIADKNLTMQDVFDTDSKYGVFVGKSLMSENLFDTIKKFNNLFNFFVQEYSYEDWNALDHAEKASGLSLVFTPEYHHQQLKESDGGECESDDEDYNTLASENNTDGLNDITNRMNLASPGF